MLRLALLAALISLAVIPVTRGAQFNVTVGGPGVLKFDPEFVTAEPGDTVVFFFKQKNHTATQSTLDSPCQQVVGGFDSGFIPVSDDNTDGPFPAAAFTVTDQNPTWVYCRQAGHCQQGMVFAVNPGDQFNTFVSNAVGNTSASSSSTPVASSATSSSSTSTPSTVSSTAISASASSTATTPSIFSTSVAPSATASSTASSSPPLTTTTTSDHQIIVGGPDALTFSPSTITAEVGDTITFVFHEKNHTATASSFSYPCRPLSETSAIGEAGFDSGFMTVDSDATVFPTYTVQVNNSAPLWVYCQQATHCGQGMVFAANVATSGPNTFDAFVAKAKQLNGTDSGSSSSSKSGARAVKGDARSGGALVAVGIALALIL